MHKINRDKDVEEVREFITEEFEHLKKTAEEGDPDGLYGVGLAYFYGWGVEEDREKGIRSFESACDAGSVFAMAHILHLLFVTHEYVLSKEKAVEYSKKAAAKGLSEGQLYLGIAYMEGAGVERDYRKAADLFRKSANQGNSEARNSLGYLYSEGLGVRKDEAKAFKLFRNAASAGNANAMYQVGICYEFGAGVSEDLEKAMEWYTEAADGGDTFAMERLGIIYRTGSAELPADPETSFEWFMSAALEGMLGAMRQVGLDYLEGFGVKKDREEGMKWLRLAASSGDEEAAAVLSGLGGENTDDGK